MLLRSGTYYGTTYLVGELDFKFTIKGFSDETAERIIAAFANKK
jgi:hypothetical protein